MKDEGKIKRREKKEGNFGEIMLMSRCPTAGRVNGSLIINQVQSVGMDFFTERVCRMREEEWRTFIVVAFPDWFGELGRVV